MTRVQFCDTVVFCMYFQSILVFKYCDKSKDPSHSVQNF